MDIKVLGTVSDDGVIMFENVKSAVVKLGLCADMQHIDNENEIAKYGELPLPALIIDGTIFSMGSVLTTREVMDLIEFEGGSEGGCGCGSGCGCGGGSC